MGRPRRKRNKTKEKKASTSDENEEDIVASWMSCKPQGLTMIHVHHLNNSRSQRILWLLVRLQVHLIILYL